MPPGSDGVHQIRALMRERQRLEMIHDGFGGLHEVRQADGQKAIDGAQMDALNSQAVRANDGFGSFSDAMDRLIAHTRSQSRFSIFDWARKFFSDRSRLDISAFKGPIAFRTQEEVSASAQVIANPTEKANPLAHAALAVYQQHVATVPPIPQIMVQSAATMVSPITGMPIGIMGVRI